MSPVVPPSPLSVESGPVRLAGDRWGDGAGPPVVLLHGGGQTRHSWDRTAERLAGSGRTAITMDARGHGDSAWDPDGDYGLEAFAGDLVRILGAVGAPAVLVGASLGGITALVVAGDRPDLVAGLVLVDVVVRVEPAGVRRIQEFMTAHPDGFATLDEVADAIAAYTPERRRARNLDGLRKNVRQGADGRWRWHWDPAFVSTGDEPRVDRRARIEQATARVAAPTMIVRGGRSDVVSDEGLADMTRRLPHARVADVAAAGHMVAGDDNDVFGAALDDFLDELG